MNKINIYLFNKTLKYILYNGLFVTTLILFINSIEISRLVEKKINFIFFLKLNFLKIPSILNEAIPFIVIISIAFLFRFLIKNNELVSIRNLGLSIFDIFKPIAIAIFLIGIIILTIINPLSAEFENQFDKIISKNYNNFYSIKIINKNMWIKNNIDKNNISYINIMDIDLNTMEAKKIKILLISKGTKKLLLADKGNIKEKEFYLEKVVVYDISSQEYKKINNYLLKLNFSDENIIDSISNYKFVPYYNYYDHLKNLEKFNLFTTEISLYYLSEYLKPLFLIVLGFVVMGFSGKFKRNENFFKILFISILIGFLFFLFKELITKLTISFNLDYIFSYFIIFITPFFIGLYQVINIENN